MVNVYNHDIINAIEGFALNSEFDSALLSEYRTLFSCPFQYH